LWKEPPLMSDVAEFEETVKASKERHPLGLYILFATEMWERFGFYTLAAILTLYLQRGGFGWTKDDATRLWSYYLMFVYFTPVFGGLLADWFLGYRRSVFLGGLFFIAGYIVLGLGSVSTFYVGLGLIIAGNGFFKPNISTMVGNLYPAGSRLKDSAYNIFYMGINVGALFAPLVAEGILRMIAGQETIAAASKLTAKGSPLTPELVARYRAGYLAAFHAAAVGLTIGTVLFAALYRKLGSVERSHPLADHTADEVAVTEDPPVSEPQAAIDKVPVPSRIGALLVIYGIVIVFWMVFHQNGSTLTYWADENTNWKFSGTISNAINPFWIVVLSLPLVKVWGWLNKRGLEPSTPTKMVLGMLLTSLSFLIMFAAAKLGGDQTFLTDASGKYLLDAQGKYQVEQHRVSWMWLVAAYGVISLGELMLSPMGLSLVSKVAPVRMRGLMMGGWFAATAAGNLLTQIGVLWTRWYHSSFFLLCALLALVMGLVLLALLRPLKRAMPGV
jgi:POT family proton-dependent oligopeptide transporter